MEFIKEYIKENKERFIEELIELLKIPSISADPIYKNDVLRCADVVAAALASAGANNVEICPTKGYPIVYGDMIIGENLPTVLDLHENRPEIMRFYPHMQKLRGKLLISIDKWIKKFNSKILC